MSEYQYYEFLAVDRPLTQQEMAELRAISTRAHITPTSFVNTYQWGDLKARPDVLLEKYFDAFIYTANWGTRECKFRLPREKVDLKAASHYCKGDRVTLRSTPAFVFFNFGTSGEEAEETDGDEGGEGMMGSLLPVRESLLAGDFCALYLSWLQRVQAGEVDEDVVEPPIPTGLRSLSGALQALAELLRLEPALVEAALEASPAKDPVNTEEVKHWIQRLPSERKDDLLAHLIVDPGTRMDLVREYRTSFNGADEAQEGRRTAGKILAEAERRREIREREAAERAERERKRFEAERAAAREKHLKKLADGETQAWARVDSLIAQKPAKYGEAVDLLKDLGEVCRRSGRAAEFSRRISGLREDHARKLTFIRRLDQAEFGR